MIWHQLVVALLLTRNLHLLHLPTRPPLTPFPPASALQSSNCSLAKWQQKWSERQLKQIRISPSTYNYAPQPQKSYFKKYMNLVVLIKDTNNSGESTAILWVY